MENMEQEALGTDGVDVGKILKDYSTSHVVYGNEKPENKEATIDAMQSNSWRCIDGRDKREGLLAYPGGALGLFVVLRAVFNGKNSSEIKEFFESKMGKITYHTDTHAIEGKAELACAGCGYAGLINTHRSEYHLDESEDLLGALGMHDKDPKADESCTILEGGHQESLAITMEDKEYVHTPAGQLGHISSFVCHSAVAFELLTKLADEFAEKSGSNYDKAKLEQIHKTHINKTLAYLQEKLKTKFPILSF